MECYYHPSRESSDVCAICGKSICKECGLEIAGKIYCKDCLEKIVGLSLNTQTQEPPKQEPVRLEKQPAPEEKIQMANLTTQPEEVSFSRVADDSPYNIKKNIQYESGIQSQEGYQPRESLHEAIEEIQVPQEPVQDVRQEFIQPDAARNEYDYSQRQAPPKGDYIYPDHSYEPGETSARREVEDKYERYLDDLYFDEDEVPLNEQLARDEEQYGSLTRKEYEPRVPKEPTADDELERRIREELARREEEKHHGRFRRSKKGKEEPIHNFQYEDEKEPYTATDILLTIILVIVIIVVVFYILYVFRLKGTYPTFVDAVLGVTDPKTFIQALLSG